MLMKVTADQVLSAMLSSSITYVAHHECGGCNYMTRYTREGTNLFFHAGCHCSRYFSLPRLDEWQAAADWINMQTNEATQQDIARRFGFAV